MNNYNHSSQSETARFFLRTLHKGMNFCRWYIGLYRGKMWITRIGIAMGSMLVSLLMFLFMVDINFLGLFGPSPGFYKIMTPEPMMASEIYSCDSVLIGRFYNENRQPVKYEEVDTCFWTMLIDTEDQRFYKHRGVDFIGVLAAFKDAALSNDARGASTITQQLAKNMYKMRSHERDGLLARVPVLRTLIPKAKEWMVATKMEICFSKEEILEKYANTVDFGSGAFGIKSATYRYFGKSSPSELNPEEAAMLVGMLKATTTYSPIKHMDKCTQRRNQVLHNALELGDLDRDEYERLSSKDIKLNLKPIGDDIKTAAYFRQAIADELKLFCEDRHIDLYTAGLKIYTTLDSRMQKYAEEAVARHMKSVNTSFRSSCGERPWEREQPELFDKLAKNLPYRNWLYEKYEGNTDSVRHYLNKPHKVKVFDYGANKMVEKQMSTMDSLKYMLRFMHTGFVAMEPQTGHVKAWVGDMCWDAWKYDKVKARRQPGSTFKLFVYTEAMNQGHIPCETVMDSPITVKSGGKDWTPRNAGGSCSNQPITIKNAFAKSVNTVAARLGQTVGIGNVARTAYKMGINSKLDEQASLVLGTSDVSLYEMTSAYCTIANDGMHVSPIMITRITDYEGDELYYGEPEYERRAVPEESARLMQQLLMGGVQGGTSTSLKNYVGAYSDTDFGGKTGTTNNNSDGWFMAVTPSLVCGAWVGGEYRSIHFSSGEGQGAKAALPICGIFLSKVLGNRGIKDSMGESYHMKFQRPGCDESQYNCEISAQTVASDSTANRTPVQTWEDSENDMATDPWDGEPVEEMPRPSQPGPASEQNIDL